MPATSSPKHYINFQASSGWTQVETRVILETPVTLSVNGEEWLTILCTPDKLEALAVGFLFNEAVINTRGEIASLHICKQNTLVDLWLNRSVEKPSRWQRTSGCTGGVTIAGRETPSSLTGAPAEVSPLAVITGMDQMLQAQAMYREAGGLHCSALSDGETIRYMAEDIGRHNTLDKLAGLLQMDDAKFIPRIIFTTGRVSSDMLQKSARMGAFLVASRTSPTSLSIKFAQKLGITLVGYVRRDHFTVYAHAERFTGVDSPIESDAAE